MNNDTFKIKSTVAPNSFEAEGPYEQVTAEYQRWLDVVRPKGESGKPVGPSGTMVIPASGGADITKGELERLFDASTDTLRIQAPINGQDAQPRALLALLLGYLTLKEQREVSGVRLKPALKQSGVPVDRIDRISDSIEDLVHSTGVKRGRKYQLTTKGISVAKAIAAELVKTVPQ